MQYEHILSIVKQDIDWAYYEHNYKDEDSLMIHESSEDRDWDWVKTNDFIHFGYDAKNEHTILHASEYPETMYSMVQFGSINDLLDEL